MLKLQNNKKEKITNYKCNTISKTTNTSDVKTPKQKIQCDTPK
jgi:hypothetical protein